MSKQTANLMAGAFLLIALFAAERLQADDVKINYPHMAPIEQYLMEPGTEIALARSAAPDSISRDAEVKILKREGYEIAAKGSNGFVCLVERSWGAGFDHPEFWNPKIRGAICMNPPAARSVLTLYLNRTKMVLAGLSKSQMIDSVKAALEKKELPLPEPGSICFMLSKQAYLTDSGTHNLAHLMFEVPRIDNAALGADLSNSPVLVGNQEDVPEPMTEVIVPVTNWSDGTPAPQDSN